MQTKRNVLRSLAPAASIGACCALLVHGQTRLSGRPMTTATQAVLSYIAPDDGPCTVEVREAGSTQLVNDVDPAVFPNSHLDTRPGSAVQGRSRVLVIGKRAAEMALDDRRHSRALQAATDHTYTIQCGAAQPLSGTFRTTSMPLGNAYMEPIPADANHPGETAWPALSWADRNQKVVDPQTGALIRQITLPGDVSVTAPREFVAASGAVWTSASAAVVDDSSAAVHSAASQEYLFLELGVFDNNGGTHSAQAARMNQIGLNVNGWCQGGNCATASVDDRSLEVCLTVDGVSCATAALTAILANCVAPPCTGSGFRFVVGDDLSNLEFIPSWKANAYANPPFDHTSVYQKEGNVNRNGNQLTLNFGHRFDLRWKAGSKATVNSQVYTIASVENEMALTLSDAPPGTESGVIYRASNFGVLARKKTASPEALALQSVSAGMIFAQGADGWDAAGGIESLTNCSNGLSAGPGGEMGWHCQISQGLYWIGKDSGTVNPIGRPLVPFRAGVDGWNSFYCYSSAFFDKQNADILYCGFRNPSTGDSSILKLQYNGQNQAVLQDFYTPLTECGSPPCWTITNLNKPSENRTIQQLVTAFHPDFAAFRNRGFQLLTSIGSTNRFLLVATREGLSNDNLGFLAYYNVATGNIDAAGPSWKYWPGRWGVIHGYLDLGDPSWTFLPLTFFRGPFTGTDTAAGNGPYYSRIASGAVGTAGTACPARPVDSPIPVNEWPTGNVCLTVTVDGEPGDPTAARYAAGTITTSGNTVTGSGVNWHKIASGLKMKIGTDFFVFTWLSSNTGTLSPTPPAVTNSAYTLFLEEVDNPKTGAARREFAYLMDAEVRDIFCGSDTTSPPNFSSPGCGLYFSTEYFRLIAKSGDTWTLERGYTKKPVREQFLALNANAYLTIVPTSCDFGVYPCAASEVYWNIDTDPLANGSGRFATSGLSKGGGHLITRPTFEVRSVASEGCPRVDGIDYSCYNVRTGTDIPSTLLNPLNQLVTGQPAFAGKLGIGVPNPVDSHPSSPGQLVPAGEKWFVDGRPLNGGVTSSQESPAANVSGSLYKFTAAQVPRMNRKILPTLAACGASPLVDVSGPATVLSGNPPDAYKYCYAERPGECQSGSQTGDIFFNCPQMSTLYCRYPGPGNQDSDLRDVCIGDNAAYTNSLIQVGWEKQNMSGAYGRSISKALARYRYVDTFWNTKMTPDGKWLINRVMWANAFGHEVVLVKVPPFGPVDSVNRADFIRIPVEIAAPASAAETHAVVEFGYNPEFQCTSRAEMCVKGGAVGYTFEYENVAGVECASGCRIEVPGIPQRVLYYRIVRRNSVGDRLVVGPVEIRVTP